MLRALHEAGVKIDVVAGRGIGAIGALFAAVDGAQRLWDEKGFWRVPARRGALPWRRRCASSWAAAAVAVLLVAVPLAVVAAGPRRLSHRFRAEDGRASAAASARATAYLGCRGVRSRPAALPTWLPRLVVLALSAALVVAAACGLAWTRRDGAARGAVLVAHGAGAAVGATGGAITAGR